MGFMKEEFKILLSDRMNKYGLFLSIGCILIGFTVFLVMVLRLPPLLPIFYNRPWGQPQLGTPLNLLLLLFMSLAVFFINITLALRFYKSIILLSRILIWVSVLVSLLATVAAIQIILLIL